MHLIAVAALAAVLSLPALVDDDILEESVRNEVDHALSRMPSPLPPAPAGTNLTADVFVTNGLSASEIAIRLVSMQREDGRWFVGTNDCTAVAAAILQSL